MVRSHLVMVWRHYLPKGGGWQTKFNVSPGPGLWSLVLGPFGPDLDLTWDLDLSLTILNYVEVMYLISSLLLHLKAKTPFHDQVFQPQGISSLLEVPGHQASVTQVTRQPGPHLGQVSVPQRGGRPRPHQGVGGQPPSSPHLLSLSPEKQQC